MIERSINADSSASVAVLLKLPVTKLRERSDQQYMARGVVQGGCRFRPDLSLHPGVLLCGCSKLVKLDQAIGGFGMREERDAIEPGLTGNVGDLPASGAFVELDRAD